MKIKKVKELNENTQKFINRDNPNTPFHSSNDPENWKKQGRYTPPPSRSPYLPDNVDNIESELEKYNLTMSDLDAFRYLSGNFKSMDRDHNDSGQLFTDMILFSRLLKQNKELVNKLLNMK